MKLWSMMGSLGFLLVAVNAWATNYVGIGTTAPAAPLHIGGIMTGADPTYRGNLIVETGETDAAANGLEFKSGNTGNGYGHRLASVYDGASNVNLQFESRQNSATWSTLMTLKGSNGYVGIGSTSPSYPLSVAGGSAGVDTIYASGTNTGIGAALDLDASGAGGSLYRIFASGSTNGLATSGFLIYDSTHALKPFFINSSGNVGIGTSSPAVPLVVNGSMRSLIPSAAGWGASYIGFTTSVNDLAGWSGTSATAYPTVATDGSDMGFVVGSTWTAYMANNGYVYAQVGFSTFSDQRLKKDVEDLDGSLEGILKLRPVSYRWIDSSHYGSESNFGFIAQEVEKVFPNMIQTGPTGYKAFSFAQLLAPIVGSIKALYAKWLDDHQKIESQAKEIAALKAAVCELNPKADICDRRR